MVFSPETDYRSWLNCNFWKFNNSTFFKGSSKLELRKFLNHQIHFYKIMNKNEHFSPFNNVTPKGGLEFLPKM